jgi:hypothetical protein
MGVSVKLGLKDFSATGLIQQKLRFEATNLPNNFKVSGRFALDTSILL